MSNRQWKLFWDVVLVLNSLSVTSLHVWFRHEKGMDGDNSPEGQSYQKIFISTASRFSSGSSSIFAFLLTFLTRSYPHVVFHTTAASTTLNSTSLLLPQTLSFCTDLRTSGRHLATDGRSSAATLSPWSSLGTCPHFKFLCFSWATFRSYHVSVHATLP